MTHAAQVVANRLEGGRLAGLGLDEAAGYAVQAEANEVLAKKLGPVAGHKIGATALGMRQLLNVPGPIAGDVFAATVHQDSATLELGHYVRPGVETEIAVRLARDLTPEEAPWTLETVIETVDALMPAIEIVDDRYQDFKSAGAGTIIADNAFNAGSILGPSNKAWHGLPLDRLEAKTIIDGRTIATGLSNELLENPLNALVWLANHMATHNRTLKTDHFVSLGTITPVQWIDRPCEVRIEVEGLGKVGVVFSQLGQERCP